MTDNHRDAEFGLPEGGSRPYRISVPMKRAGSSLEITACCLPDGSYVTVTSLLVGDSIVESNSRRYATEEAMVAGLLSAAVTVLSPNATVADVMSLSKETEQE